MLVSSGNTRVLDGGFGSGLTACTLTERDVLWNKVFTHASG